MQPNLQDMIAECQRLCPGKRFALSDGINGGDVVWLAEIGNGTKDDLLAESTTPACAVEMLLEQIKRKRKAA
jgi:hypothetical protein